MTGKCEMADVTFFDCDTIEDAGALPKIKIAAEVTFAKIKTINNVDTNAIRSRLLAAAVDAVMFDYREKDRDAGDAA